MAAVSVVFGGNHANGEDEEVINIAHCCFWTLDRFVADSGSAVFISVVLEHTVQTFVSIF